MKPNYHHEQLLNDVLLDEKLADLKAKVLGQCLGELKRRHNRSYGVCIVTAAAAILFLALVLRRDAAPPKPVDRPSTPDYVVQTVPLSARQIVRTAVSCETVRTQTNACAVQNTSIASDLKVQERYKVARLNDTEMLQFFDGASCGIIRPQGGRSRLVFFNPEDAKRYLGTP